MVFTNKLIRQQLLLVAAVNGLRNNTRGARMLEKAMAKNHQSVMKDKHRQVAVWLSSLPDKTGKKHQIH